MPIFVGERKYNKNPQYPYECPFCDSTYGRVDFLEHHMSLIHTEDLKQYEASHGGEFHQTEADAGNHLAGWNVVSMPCAVATT